MIKVTIQPPRHQDTKEKNAEGLSSMLSEIEESVAKKIAVGAAFTVHKKLSPGLLEKKVKRRVLIKYLASIEKLDKFSLIFCRNIYIIIVLNFQEIEKLFRFDLYDM